MVSPPDALLACYVGINRRCSKIPKPEIRPDPEKSLESLFRKILYQSF